MDANNMDAQRDNPKITAFFDKHRAHIYTRFVSSTISTLLNSKKRVLPQVHHRSGDFDKVDSANYIIVSFLKKYVRPGILTVTGCWMAPEEAKL